MNAVQPHVRPLVLPRDGRHGLGVPPPERCFGYDLDATLSSPPSERSAASSAVNRNPGPAIARQPRSPVQRASRRRPQLSSPYQRNGFQLWRGSE